MLTSANTHIYIHKNTLNWWNTLTFQVYSDTSHGNLGRNNKFWKRTNTHSLSFSHTHTHTDACTHMVNYAFTNSDITTWNMQTI